MADARAINVWRLGGGAAGLSLGIVLIAGPMGTGFGGFLGALCVLIGLAALAGLAAANASEGTLARIPCLGPAIVERP